MADKTVPVTIPAWMWGRLATIADHRNVTVADLVADGIARVLDSDAGRLEQLGNELNAVRASGWRSPQRNRRTA